LFGSRYLLKNLEKNIEKANSKSSFYFWRGVKVIGVPISPNFGEDLSFMSLMD